MKFQWSSDLGTLLLRFAVGLSMAFAHGLGKLPPSEQLIEGVGMIGFPAPLLFAWSAALSEFAGGLFIAMGLFTRIAAGFLGFTMAVAMFVVHAQDPFQKKELAFLFLFVCLFFVLHGAGKYSLDRMLRKK